MNTVSSLLLIQGHYLKKSTITDLEKNYHRRTRKRNKKIFSHEYWTGSVIGSAAAFPQQHSTDNNILRLQHIHLESQQTTYDKNL
jgi:hypothetical protein